MSKPPRITNRAINGDGQRDEIGATDSIESALERLDIGKMMRDSARKILNESRAERALASGSEPAASETLKPRGKTAKRPKTQSALNAIRHGIRTARVLAEEQPAYERHLACLEQSLEPQGYLEELLVGRIALALWRLYRVTNWEALAIRGNVAEAHRSNLLGGGLLDREIPDDEAAMLSDGQAGLVARYEAHLERSLYRALHELEVMQHKRKGNTMTMAQG